MFQIPSLAKTASVAVVSYVVAIKFNFEPSSGWLDLALGLGALGIGASIVFAFRSSDTPSTATAERRKPSPMGLLIFSSLATVVILTVGVAAFSYTTDNAGHVAMATFLAGVIGLSIIAMLIFGLGPYTVANDAANRDETEDGRTSAST